MTLLATWVGSAEACREMVDPGEFVTTTLRREFAEEALDLEGADEKTKHAIEKRID